MQSMETDSFTILAAEIIYIWFVDDFMWLCNQHHFCLPIYAFDVFKHFVCLHLMVCPWLSYFWENHRVVLLCNQHYLIVPCKYSNSLFVFKTGYAFSFDCSFFFFFGETFFSSIKTKTSLFFCAHYVTWGSYSFDTWGRIGDVGYLSIYHNWYSFSNWRALFVNGMLLWRQQNYI